LRKDLPARASLAREGEPILDELLNIRSLLTSPVPANIRVANEGLKKLMPSLDEVAMSVSVQEQGQSVTLESLSRLRSEILVISMLAQSGADYFRGLGTLQNSGFEGYERTGARRFPDALSRTIVQL
jgi:hypothetical protein